MDGQDDAMFLIDRYTFLIEFTLSYMALENRFGSHISLKKGELFVCEAKSSDYVKMFEMILEGVPIDILRTIIVAMQITNSLYSSGGELHKSGKRYLLPSTEMHIDEYIELIRTKSRVELSNEITDINLCYPYNAMINLGNFVSLETIYNDFSKRRFPTWAFPGGLTIKARKTIKQHKLNLPETYDLFKF